MVAFGITYRICANHSQKQSLLNVTVNGGTHHRPVLVSSDSFTSTSSIVISISNPGSKSAALYQTPCDNLTLSTDRSSPPQHFSQLSPDSFIREGYNYDVGTDVPINLAPGSNLTYIMNASSTSSDPGCLSLYLFDSYSAYDSFLGTNNNAINNYVARSRCVNVSTSGPPAQTIIVFHIVDKQANYYVAFETPGNITFDAEITATPTYYDTKGLKMPCSNRLSSSQHICIIDRCVYSIPDKRFCFKVKKNNICFLIVSNDVVNVIYQTKTATYDINSSYIFSAMIAMILLTVILIICSIFCCCYFCLCKKRENRSNPSKGMSLKDLPRET